MGEKYSGEIINLESNGKEKIDVNINGNMTQETREGYNLCNAPYTVDNKYTFTASKDDDNRVLGYYATLEAGIEYKVSFESDGAYGTEHGEDTVQIFLLKDQQYDNYFTIKSKDYIFTPTVSGDYYIRIDINKNGVTHSFWNFFIRKSTETREFEPYGKAPTPDFPSEIKTVTGNVEIEIANKVNIIPIRHNEYEQGGLMGEGGTIVEPPSTARVRTKEYYPISKKDYIMYVTNEKTDVRIGNIHYYDKNKNWLTS